ncbi:MAG: TIGR03086 family protein [Nocardiopsaceae bacterium]|nr:TIGR03086 family protein [Nocardiopsaceae bacterium]
MTGSFDAVADRFAVSSQGFAGRLRAVLPGQWSWPTPCTEWTVRDLVNHMTRGNLSYARLLQGGTAAEFLRCRDEDALGADPVGAYTRSVRACAGAFAARGAPDRMVDYPLGMITGRQALAVRTADSIIHTWDLARAIGADERLDPDLVTWVGGHLRQIYAGLAETPVAANTTHRFFAAPRGELDDDAPRQDHLLHLMGRTPGKQVTSQHQVDHRPSRSRASA